MKRNKTSRRSAKRKERNVPMSSFIQKNQDNYTPKTWVVYTVDGSKRKSPRVMNSKLSRDEVRNAYSKEFGVKIQETRSRRVANW